MEEFLVLDKYIDASASRLYMECTNISASYFMDDDYYTEADGDKKEGPFKKIIAGLRKMINTVIEKITSLFQKKEVDDTIKAANAAGAEEKSKKVKMKNYKKLEKLNDDTMKEVESTNDPEALKAKMEKYKKQRNIILGAGAAATVTVGGVLLFLNKKGKDKIKDLDKRRIRAEKLCVDLEEKYISASEEASKYKHGFDLLKTKHGETITKYNRLVTAKNEEIRKKGSELASLQKNLAAAEKKWDGSNKALATQINGLKAKISTKEAEIQFVKTELSNAKNTIDSLKHERGKNLERIQNIRIENKKMKSKLKNANIPFAQKKAESVVEIVANATKDTTNMVQDCVAIAKGVGLSKPANKATNTNRFGAVFNVGGERRNPRNGKNQK